MKNREKRREEIIQACKKRTLCKDILKKFVLPSFGQTCSEDSPCNDTECDSCQFLAVLWLDEEYKEPEVDWSKVAVDTPVLVKNAECAGWVKRHFAKYEDGQVYAFDLGCTSWTNSRHATSWNYAKLAELEEAE
ncbi:hypothetical protein OBO34_14350 [Clostridiales Family XIII bacterium ASD5510]|uniref:Uncharacterized protein n=1 Tax=Hominibacterium faecale TaxID=2839743 RepID=A0A9J6QUT4_9FIRM|nr:hypothetical protein [Hominibacterium faecale]MCU7379524.1 hypothetical protein [Hominibacterium faecale]